MTLLTDDGLKDEQRKITCNNIVFIKKVRIAAEVPGEVCNHFFLGFTGVPTLSLYQGNFCQHKRHENTTAGPTLLNYIPSHRVWIPASFLRGVVLPVRSILMVR